MRKVTAEQVKDAMIGASITRLQHHECGDCHKSTYYCREGSRLYYDPSCECRNATPQPRSWQEAADSINLQTDPEIQILVAKSWGLVLGPLVNPESNGHGGPPRFDDLNPDD
jgi:hypothetical protein